MSKKRKRRTTTAPSQSARQSRRTTRKRRRSGGVNPLVWVGGVLVIVIVLVGINLLSGASANKPPTVSRQDPAGLLPLAERRKPLKGGHDMARIPQQTPAPQPAPEDVALPKVDLPIVSYDFGRIPKRPDVVYVFAVQNTGSADLELWNLVTSCGCTTAELSSSIIPPGRRADLTVTFDPDFHPTQGPVTRLVWFATNDPTQPWVEIRITADVSAP